jgi:hypothetical protein
VITEIDVRGVLARCVSDVQRDLVTRPTGRAVRTSIETELASLSGRTVVVLDFSQVRIIDCSCADEIVAKLVQASLAADAPDAFFLLRGLDDDQIDDVEAVLSHQQLALVTEAGGTLRLIGAVRDTARELFARLVARGGALAEELAAELDWPLEEVREALDELAMRHLILRDAGRYRTPTAA